jgi:hypothetical protein
MTTCCLCAQHFRRDIRESSELTKKRQLGSRLPEEKGGSMTPEIILARTGIDVTRVEQGDESWHRLRLGVITASKFTTSFQSRDQAPNGLT